MDNKDETENDDLQSFVSFTTELGRGGFGSNLLWKSMNENEDSSGIGGVAEPQSENQNANDTNTTDNEMNETEDQLINERISLTPLNRPRHKERIKRTSEFEKTTFTADTIEIQSNEEVHDEDVEEVNVEPARTQSRENNVEHDQQNGAIHIEVTARERGDRKRNRKQQIPRRLMKIIPLESGISGGSGMNMFCLSFGGVNLIITIRIKRLMKAI